MAQEIIEIGGLVIDVSWWPYLFWLIKCFFIFLTISFTAGIILILYRVEDGFKVRIKEIIVEAFEDGKLSKNKIKKQWESVILDIESENPDDYKNAVISAEKLFNRVLKVANFSGDNVEQKLRKIPEGQLELKDEIVWSSNLKEKIVNDPNFEVDPEEAKRAVNVFEKTLKEMGVL